MIIIPDASPALPACPMPRDPHDYYRYALATTYTCGPRSKPNKRPRVHDLLSHFVSTHWGSARMTQPRENYGH